MGSRCQGKSRHFNFVLTKRLPGEAGSWLLAPLCHGPMPGLPFPAFRPAQLRTLEPNWPALLFKRRPGLGWADLLKSRKRELGGSRLRCQRAAVFSSALMKQRGSGSGPGHPGADLVGKGLLWDPGPCSSAQEGQELCFTLTLVIGPGSCQGREDSAPLRRCVLLRPSQGPTDCAPAPGLSCVTSDKLLASLGLSLLMC